MEYHCVVQKVTSTSVAIQEKNIVIGPVFIMIVKLSCSHLVISGGI